MPWRGGPSPEVLRHAVDQPALSREDQASASQNRTKTVHLRPEGGWCLNPSRFLVHGEETGLGCEPIPSMNKNNAAPQSPKAERLHHMSWRPDSAVRGVVVLVHGLAEHCGRYGHVVEALLAQGVAVHALDLPGHGRSGGARLAVHRFSDFTDAVAWLHRRVRREYPEVPVFLLGHSMGGLIVVRHAIDQPQGIQGLILSAPALQITPNIGPWQRCLTRRLARWAPNLGLPGLELSGISRDVAVMRAYAQDPWVHHGRTPAGLAGCLLGAIEGVVPDLPRLQLPFLVLQGGGDRLVHSEGARLLMRQAGSRDKQLRWYEGLYHEVFNEPERAQVIGDVLDWLGPRLLAAPAAADSPSR